MSTLTLADMPYPIVEHPDFEVHSFHSLARKIGRSANGLSYAVRVGNIKVIAFNHQNVRNIFAISKTEIERISLTKPGKHIKNDSRSIHQVPQDIV